MEYFVISAKFVPLKYYTLSSQLQRLVSFSVGCSGRRILSPGQINIMRKWCIHFRLDKCANVAWPSPQHYNWYNGVVCIKYNLHYFWWGLCILSSPFNTVRFFLNFQHMAQDKRGAWWGQKKKAVVTWSGISEKLGWLVENVFLFYHFFPLKHPKYKIWVHWTISVK